MNSSLLVAASFAAIASSAASAQPAAQAALQPASSSAGTSYGNWGVDLRGRDLSVRPGDDFANYANGAWDKATAIPADQPNVSVGYDVYNRTQAQLRQVVEEAAAHPDSPVARQVGDLYRAYMDEGRIEQLDDRPLRPDLDAIRALSERTAVARFMGRAQGGFGRAVFDADPEADDKAPQRMVLRLGQSGLGMPDRDFYISDSFKAQKAAYQEYVARTLKMIGWPDAEVQATAIVAFETRIAEASWPLADQRDSVKVYNPMSLADLQALTPGFDWRAYFSGAGLPNLDRVVVNEKSAFPKIATLFAAVPIETLKAYEAFHVADQASPYLSKRFVDSRFAFRGRALSGLQENRPRWKRAVSQLDQSLGEAVGRVYVDRFFPAQSKAEMQTLVGNLKIGMRARIERLDWMAPQTKAVALEKLDKLRVMVGYPDKWRDYAGLKIEPTDLYGDIARSRAFEWRYHADKLPLPVDPSEWFMNPQTVDAYNDGNRNEIVFPAGILQAPYFNAAADPAANYGAIGAVIGHEITHGFDDQGRQYDALGMLRDWWTPQDAARFERAASQLAAQYDTYEVVPGVRLKGRQTLGENIADLGGLQVALDAYHASLKGKPAPVIDGLTGDQRFYLAFAQVWKMKGRPDALKQQAVADVHATARYRIIGPLRNIDAWYQAFDVKPGETYYLPPDQRVRIW